MLSKIDIVVTLTALPAHVETEKCFLEASLCDLLAVI